MQLNFNTCLPSMLVLLIVLFAGCDSDSNGTASEPHDEGTSSINPADETQDLASKSLFDLWVKVEDDVYNLGTWGLLGLNTADGFGSDIPLVIHTVELFSCNCFIQVNGTQTAGTYLVSSCAWQFEGEAGGPDCTIFEGTGNYTKSNDRLTLTNALGETAEYE